VEDHLTCTPPVTWIALSAEYPEVAHELFGTLDDRLDGLDRFLEFLAALGRPQTLTDTAIAAGRLTAGDPPGSTAYARGPEIARPSTPAR